jgi:general secretion pathway protein G
MVRHLRRAFTLVEILIVVVILGILAAVVVPQFARAVGDSSETATFDQLSRVRRALSYYYATNSGAYPTVTAGDGTWGPLLPVYMREQPKNFWVPPAASKVIVLSNAADSGYVTDHGWVYNSATGEVWAAGFDAFDNAYPR